MSASFTTHGIILNSITLLRYGNEYILWNFQLSILLRLPVKSIPLRLNTIVNTVFSNAVKYALSFGWETKTHTHIKLKPVLQFHISYFKVLNEKLPHQELCQQTPAQNSPLPRLLHPRPWEKDCIQSHSCELVYTEPLSQHKDMHVMYLCRCDEIAWVGVLGKLLVSRHAGVSHCGKSYELQIAYVYFQSTLKIPNTLYILTWELAPSIGWHLCCTANNNANPSSPCLIPR